MKIFILFILLLGLVCCREKDPRRHSKSDPEFREFIEAFEEECNCSINHIPINFATDIGRRIGPNIVGVCWTYIGRETWKEIEIDPYYWYEYASNDLQREQLIFHELGHCALNRDNHIDSHFLFDTIIYGNKTCPKSIMRSWAFDIYEIDYCYDLNYDYYMDELFGRISTSSIESLYSDLRDEHYYNQYEADIQYDTIHDEEIRHYQ